MKHTIPGTTIFDGTQARKGYALNRMCFSFNSAANREAFRGDEEGYMRQYGLTPPQAEATMARSSRRFGAKMPGVSMNTNWVSASVTTPRICARVVCALWVTIDTLVPPRLKVGAPLTSLRAAWISDLATFS